MPLQTYASVIKEIYKSNGVKEAGKATFELLDSSVKEFATSTVGAFTIGTAAAYGMYKAIQALSDAYNLSYDSAIKNTEESFSNFSSTKTEVEDLKSKVDTARDSLTSMADTYNIEIDGTESIAELIDKLKSSDLSLEDRSQVSQIEQENASIERQIALKEKLLEYQQKEAASNAMDTMKRGEQSVAQQVAQNVPGGKRTYQGMVDNVDVVDAVKEDVKAIKDYEDKIAELERKQAGFDVGSKKWKQAEEDINSYNEAIQTLTSDLDSKQADLTTLLKSFSVDGEGTTALSGYEEQFNAIKDALNSINNIDLAPAQQQLASIESFFDGSTGKNFIKDSLLDAAKNGKNLEYVLNGLGYELSDIGENVDIETLSKYFDDLANSANEAANAVKEVNNNLTMDDIASSFESKNAGDDYVALNDYLKKAKELYDQGLTGTDDFKSVAEAISYNIDSSAESFKQNYDKLQRYFTEDGDGNLTGQGVQNFLTDLQSLGKGYATWNEESGKWDINMSNTAQAAKELGISVQTMEALLGRIKDYDNLGEFDFTSAIDEFETAKSSLESLRSLYDEMESSDRKDALGLKLDEWESQLGTWENDLATLDSDVVLNIKLEYDLATIQSQIDEVKGLIEGGDNSVENNAQVIAGNQKYINIAEEGLGLNVEGVTIPVEYQANEDTIEALKAQLKNATSEEDKVKIQAEIENLQELQKDLLNAFSDAHPEINADSSIEEINNAWNDFVSSNDGKEIIAKMIADDEEAKEKIAELLDIEPEDIVVPVSADTSNAEKSLNHVEAYEFSEKVAELTANDDATPYLKLWNELSMNPKFGIMKAEDQATYVVALWNALTPEQKEAYLKGEITVTDNATGTVQTIDGALNALPLNPNAEITAKDLTSGAVSSANLALNSIDGKTAHTYIVTHKTTKGDNDLSGTAHVEGTAHASGTIEDDSWIKPKWRTKKDEVSLVGEEAPEIVATREGTWYTVGDKGAEFAHIPKDSVVFNGQQTKELLTKGRIRGRGRSLLGGTSYLGSSSGGFSFSDGASKYNGKSSQKSSSTQNAVESAAETVSDTAESVLDTISNTTDWIERKIEVASKATEKAVNALEESVTFSDKMANNEAAIQKVKNELYWNQLGANRYREFEIDIINKTGLSSDILDKIYNGAIELSDYDEDTRSKIEEYTEWYDKTQKLLDNIEELRKQEKELALERVEYAKDWYDALTSIQDVHKNLGEANVDLKTAQGKNINDSEIRGALNYQLTHTQEYLALQQRERDEMWAQMMRLLSEGYITAGDDNYNDMLEQIYELDASIIKSKSDIIDIEDQFRQITYDQIQQAIDKYERITERNEAVLSLLESKGYVANENEYIKIIKANEEQIKQIEELIAQKQKEQSKYEIGSERYEELADEINELDISMINLLKDNEDLKKSIRDIKWDSFDKLQESITAIIDEADYLIDLMSEDKMFNDNGSMTDQAKAIVGLHGVNYNAYMNQAEKYKAEMKSISEELANDPNNQDLIDRRKELLELQRESILAAEDEKQAMKDLVKDGIDKTLDALKELISKYEDALDSQKDLRDFEKDIANKQEKIASYEKQLKAYENDTSEEGATNRQQIQNALKEAREDLDDTMYDRSISDQKKLLDNLYDEYEELLNKRLDNIDQLISEMIDNINMDSSLIIDTIKAEAEAVGYTLTDDMLNIWNNNGDVGKIISVYDDKFMDTVTGVKSSIDDIKTLLERVVGSDILNLPDYSHKEETESTTDTENNNFVQEVQKVQSSIDAIRERIKDRMELSKEVLVQSKSSASELAKDIRDSFLRMGNNADVLLNTQALQQQQLVDAPQLPVIPVKNNSTVQQNIEMNVAIERVMDYNDFLSQLRNDSKFEKLIHAITIDQLDGGSSLSKYNIRI